MRKLLGVAVAAVLMVVALTFLREPTPVLALEAPAVTLERLGAGDSVRFVARFTVPAQAAVDSVAARWQIPFNALAQFRVWTPATLPATITDTALAAAPPQPGGGNGFGSYTVTVWRGGQSTPVVKALELTVADLPPPLGASGLVFLDSAVVINP